jgi:hypothetical protein
MKWVLLVLVFFFIGCASLETNRYCSDEYPVYPQTVKMEGHEFSTSQPCGLIVRF